MLTPSTFIVPDLDDQPWREEDGFFHGFLNGMYYRMVCSSAEIEEMRQKALEEDREEDESAQLMSLEELWQILDEYYDPNDAHFGPFEPASPFEEDLDSDARRRLLAMNMYASPTTTTWYGLSHLHDDLIGLSQKARQQALHQRLRDMGLDPKQVRSLETQRQWTLALEFGLNPFVATEEDIMCCQLELHKIVLPRALAEHTSDYLQDQPLTFADLLRTALETYLANQPGTEHC